MFNINNFLHTDALSPAIEWKGYPKFNFIGGHNDPESIPIISLKESIDKIILKVPLLVKIVLLVMEITLPSIISNK